MSRDEEAETVHSAKRERRERSEISPQRENKVPPWAEDMEHTLRRINAEKQEKRSANPWLYR